MNSIEICAGPNQSFTNTIKSMCDDTLTIDIEDYEGIDIVADFTKLPWPLGVGDSLFNIMWASVPCQTYSVAGIRHHRRDAIIPISQAAKDHDKLVEAVLIYVDVM